MNDADLIEVGRMAVELRYLSDMKLPRAGLLSNDEFRFKYREKKSKLQADLRKMTRKLVAEVVAERDAVPAVEK